MAYHAGAELSGIECFQVNPLIKDYNGPACAYVANPFGGYQVQCAGGAVRGIRLLVGPDDGGGEARDRIGPRAHLPEGLAPTRRDPYPRWKTSCTPPSGPPGARSTPTAATITAPTTSRCTSPKSVCAVDTPHLGYGWTSTLAPRSLDFMRAGDLACVPHNYMIGAFVYGDLAGEHAASTIADAAAPQALPEDQLKDAHELVYGPLRRPRRPAAAAGGIQAAPVRQRLRGPRPRRRPSCRSPCRALSGCTTRSPRWAPPHHTS